MKPSLIKLIFIEEPATVHISVDLLKNLSESSVLSNCFCTLPPAIPWYYLLYNIIDCLHIWAHFLDTTAESEFPIIGLKIDEFPIIEFQNILTSFMAWPRQKMFRLIFAAIF